MSFVECGPTVGIFPDGAEIQGIDFSIFLKKKFQVDQPTFIRSELLCYDKIIGGQWINRECTHEGAVVHYLSGPKSFDSIRIDEIIGGCQISFNFGKLLPCRDGGAHVEVEGNEIHFVTTDNKIMVHEVVETLKPFHMPKTFHGFLDEKAVKFLYDRGERTFYLVITESDALGIFDETFELLSWSNRKPVPWRLALEGKEKTSWVFGEFAHALRTLPQSDLVGFELTKDGVVLSVETNEVIAKVFVRCDVAGDLFKRIFERKYFEDVVHYYPNEISFYGHTLVAGSIVLNPVGQ